jgi:hypothetical protein
VVFVRLGTQDEQKMSFPWRLGVLARDYSLKLDKLTLAGKHLPLDLKQYSN